MPSKVCCIFAGARGNAELLPDAAFVATRLVSLNWDLIYGGSSKGVMGAVCAATKRAGGKITGVLPEKVYALQHYDKEIDMLVADTMAARKQHFWNKSDAFLLLPGSYGSLDEFYEVLTLVKLGYMPAKPIVVYNPFGYYDPLIEMHKNMIKFGTLTNDRADLVKFTNNPAEAVRLVTGEK